MEVLTRPMTIKPKILIIDDSISECLILRKYLSPTAVPIYEIQTANDFSEARKILATTHFDCILLDYLIGAETGLDFIRKINPKLDADSAVIMITGYANPELKEQALEAGFNAFISKDDMTQEHLNQCVQSLIKVTQERPDDE